MSGSSICWKYGLSQGLLKADEYCMDKMLPISKEELGWMGATRVFHLGSVFPMFAWIYFSNCRGWAMADRTCVRVRAT